MDVRRARNEDREALGRLWRELDALHATLVPGFFRDAPIVAAAPSPAGDGRRHGALLVAALDDGELAGAVDVQLYDTPASPAHRPRRRLHVERIVVARAHRRRGVGRRLMDAACAFGVAGGATQLLLTVWAGNDEAERFYRALGYATVSSVLARDLP